MTQASQAWLDRAEDIGAVLNTPTTDIADVLRKLHGLQPVFDAFPWGEDTPTACFNRLYATITEAVDGEASVQGYDRRAFLVRLDVEFAARYFDAITAMAGNPHSTRGPGLPQPAPAAWRVVFEAADEVSPKAAAAAGVNAHINYDLAPALVATLRPRTLFPSRRSSEFKQYHKVNDIFRDHIVTLRRQFAGDDDYLAWLDFATGDLDDMVDNALVRATRDGAWRIAKGYLWPVRGVPHRSEYLARQRALDEAAAAAGSLITSRSARVVFGGSDALSWPQLGWWLPLDDVHAVRGAVLDRLRPMEAPASGPTAGAGAATAVPTQQLTPVFTTTEPPAARATRRTARGALSRVARWTLGGRLRAAVVAGSPLRFLRARS